MSTTAVATQQPSGAVTKAPVDKTLKGLLQGDDFKRAVAQALPTHLKPDRFIRVALTAMTKTPLLAQCEQASFFQCLLTLSQLGLEPDGRRAHLIPFKNNKKGIYECQLIVDYKGLCELLINTGLVSFIHADVICENDEFDYDRGEIKKHKIDLRKDRGPSYAVYAIIRFKDGTEKSEVMSMDEVDAIRQRSRAKDGGPWVTDYREMAKKTVFKRAAKWVKWSPEQRDLIDADDDQFENKVQAAKPVFGTIEAPAAIFALPEPAPEIGNANPTDPGQASEPEAVATPEPPKETKEPTKKSSPLVTDKTQVADFMAKNKLEWPALAAILNAFPAFAAWVDSVPDFDSLTPFQAKTIWNARSLIEGEMKDKA